MGWICRKSCYVDGILYGAGEPFRQVGGPIIPKHFEPENEVSAKEYSPGRSGDWVKAEATPDLAESPGAEGLPEMTRGRRKPRNEE